MIRPQHIPLKHRNALAGRLLCLPALYRNASEAARGRSRNALVSLRSDLINLTLEALKQPEPAQLDSFLESLSQDLKANAAPWLSKRSSDAKLVRRALSDIQRAVRQISCAKCALSKAQICRGQNVDDDSRIVDQGGQCLLPIKKTFHVAQKVARSYYNRFAKNLLTQAQPAKIVLFTRDEGAKPHEFAESQVPFQVSGVTDFDPGQQGWDTIVTLVFWVREFDWETYLACPYVLLHELICHAFKNPLQLPSQTPRQPDPFAEGWMDWVAFSILEESYRSGSAFPTKDKGEVRVARMYHEGRLNFNHKDSPEDSVEWALGKEAAEKVLCLLQKLTPAYQETFFRISFQFNLSPYGWNVREEFVKKLAKYLVYKEDRKPRNQTRYDKLVQIFRKYLKRKGLQQLVTEVLNL